MSVERREQVTGVGIDSVNGRQEEPAVSDGGGNLQGMTRAG